MTDTPTLTVAARRHRWHELPEKRIAACEFTDGNDRTEKTCALCGLVKITVHSPDNRHWNEWRHPNGKTFQCEATPPCVNSVESNPVCSVNQESETAAAGGA